MKLFIQLIILGIIYFIILRYDLGLSQSKAISRAILFSLIVVVLYLIIQTPTIETYNTIADTNENYDAATDSDESDSEPSDSDESDSDESESGDSDSDEDSTTKSKKSKKSKIIK